jgi:ribosomal protein S18 acetylase RimI-like enzyme
VRTHTLTLARPEHFAAIADIERASDSSTAVSLTQGAALQEALDRGHWVIVALEGEWAAGWIWFSVELGRSGEYVGQVFRVGVAGGSRRKGVGSALVAHARKVFQERDVDRVRLTVPAGDAAAIAFFEALGFEGNSLTMERAP